MDDDIIIIEEYENLDEARANLPFRGGAADRKPHTRLGLLCFIIGVAGGLLEFVLFLFFGSSAGNSPLDLRGINSGEIRPILVVATVMLLHSFGLLAGIISLVRKEKNIGIPILGLLVNLAVMGATVILVGAAWIA